MISIQTVQGPRSAPEVLKGGNSVVLDENGRTSERLTLWYGVKARIFFIEWTKRLEVMKVQLSYFKS